MRIAHVSVGALPAVFSDGGGAVQRRVAELAVAQAAGGHDVTILSPGSEPLDGEPRGVQTRFLPCRADGPSMHWEFLLRARRALGAAPAPDIVHVHNEPEGAAILAGVGRGIVLSFDNFYFRQRLGARLRHTYRSLLLRFDILMPVSRYCAEAASAHWDLPASRVQLLPNGVNTSQFLPQPHASAAERRRLALSGDVLVYLGRICRQKGIHVLLDGFVQLRRRARRPVHLVLAGPIGQFDERERPDEAAAWQQAIDRAGAIYIGQVPEKRLAALLGMADVFVMPTVELEMQGMAALEALACGVPVVASDHGGLRETVPDACGVRFATGSSAGLADAVLELLDDPRRREALGAGAMAHASRYAWPRIAGRATDAYGAILSRGGHALR